MNKKIITALCLLIFSIVTIKVFKNNFVSLSSMKEIQEKIKSESIKINPEEVLVIFDVDMVLTQPVNPAAHYAALVKYLSIYKKMAASISNEAKNIAATYLTQFIPQELVEKETPKIITYLQSKGFKTIALTASLTGKFNDSKNKFIFQKRDLLQKMGIDFEQSKLPFGTAIPFTDFPKYVEGYPTYYHGILCSNGDKGPTNKGTVLVAFLEHIGQKSMQKVKHGYFPKIIFMVDDKKDNLTDVKNALKKDFPEINFVGIEYEGAKLNRETSVTQQEFEEFWQKIIQDSKEILN